MSASDRTFSVLVTGLLRTPDRLWSSIEGWNRLRDRKVIDRVVLVTWSSEAEREPALCDALRDAGVEVVVRPDTKIRGIGNIWPQMYAMEVGLDAFQSDETVFKTRTDLWLDPELLTLVACTPGYLDLELPAGSARVFERRVWVPWFELTKPFYLSDECFVGRAGDLRLLINYDESYSLRYPVSCGITHYRRFVHPFRGLSSRFEVFLERFTDVGLGTPERWDRLRELLKDDAYLGSLADSYAVLGSHFRFESPDGSIEFRDWSSGSPQPSAGPLAESFDESRQGLESGHLFCNSDRWLHRLLASELPADALGERFEAELLRARDEGLGWFRPIVDLPAVVAGASSHAG